MEVTLDRRVLTWEGAEETSEVIEIVGGDLGGANLGAEVFPLVCLSICLICLSTI